MSVPKIFSGNFIPEKFTPLEISSKNQWFRTNADFPAQRS